MIFRSPYPDITIPDLPLTQFVLQHAERPADKPALIDGSTGRTLTYGQLADGIRRTAVGLADRGFHKGDIFATVCPSIPEFALAFYGVAALGGATTMLNPLYTAGEMATQFADAGARFVLTVPERLEVVREATAGTSVEEVFVVGEAVGATPFASLLSRDGAFPKVDIDPTEDVVALPYSSGTTGRPKGVMITHRNIVAVALMWRAANPIAEGEVVATLFPCFHIGGVETMNIHLSGGATLVTMSRFDLPGFLRLLQKHRAGHAVLPPPVILALARQPMVDDYDLSSLRLIRWGGAPLSEDVIDDCRERLGCRVQQGYGLTEAAGLANWTPDKDEDRPGSGGPAMPNMAWRVVDTVTGNELGPGETGEICVRGPNVMKGYLNNAEATAGTIDADGWLHTGDLGFADAEGWIHIVDRLKELIKYKAYQVAPAELEAVLLAHPAVADAAVIPSPDDVAGEVPKAFVVLKSEASADDLMAFVAARVAPYKKVRRVEFVEQIPKSASGKILRRILVERERAALLSPV